MGRLPDFFIPQNAQIYVPAFLEELFPFNARFYKIPSGFAGQVIVQLLRELAVEKFIYRLGIQSALKSCGDKFFECHFRHV